MKKLSGSKSDQDLASRSPHSAEVGSYITSGPRGSAANARTNAFRNSATGTPGGSVNCFESSLFATTENKILFAYHVLF